MKLEELDWKNVALGIAAPSSLLSLRIRLWRVEETNLLSELDRELSILFSISSYTIKFFLSVSADRLIK